MVGAQIDGEILAIRDMNSSVGNGQVRGIGVEVDAEDAAVNRRDAVGSEANGVLAVAAVELVIAEARVGVDGGDGAAVSVAMQLRECDGTIGRDAGDSAVFKLDLDAAVFGGDETHAFDGGHVGLSLVKGEIGAVENLDFALDVAQAHSADVVRVG